MSRFHSLKKNPQFAAVYREKRSKANRFLVMYVTETEDPDAQDINRVGISVSKKVGNSVVRHRIKRVIREIIRTDDAMFDKGSDIVIIARAEAKNAGYRELEKAVIQLFRRHGMLRKMYE